MGFDTKMSVILTFFNEREQFTFCSHGRCGLIIWGFSGARLWENHGQLLGCMVMLEDLVWLSATPLSHRSGSQWHPATLNSGGPRGGVYQQSSGALATSFALPWAWVM